MTLRSNAANKLQLGEKVAFITGPARGIGEGVARSLATRGYRVVLVGLEVDRLNELAREINESVGQQSLISIALEADVTDTEALDRAVDQAIQTFGRIDVVVANAGIANNGSFASTHVEDLVRVIDVNLSGVLRTMKSTYNALLDSRGYALLISSASAFPALPGITAYGASKAGVDHFANNLRIEMRSAGVEIGVAYPSWIDTDLVRDQQDELPYFRKALEAEPNFFGKVTPLGECVSILVEGIEMRRRRIYIPDSVRFLHALRSFTVTSVWDFAIGYLSRHLLTEMNDETRQLGRSFGKTSVETKPEIQPVIPTKKKPAKTTENG